MEGKNVRCYHRLPFSGPPLVERTWLRVKQGSHLSLGAVPHEIAICTGKLRGIDCVYKSDACISGEQTIFFAVTVNIKKSSFQYKWNQ